MINYPKFQYSKMLNGDQIVVRSEDKTEFEDLVKYVRSFYKVERTDPYKDVKTNVSVDEFEDNHICPAHGVQMESRVSKNTGKPYWSHRSSEGALCFGKAYLPKK